MNDNPFSEPEDNERTVLRLPKGHRGATVAAAPNTTSHAAAMPAAGQLEAIPRVGRSRLVAAAAPLLDLLARIGAKPTQVADGAELRGRAVSALQSFESECRAAQVSDEQLRAAHYALCAALDDTALATPWGQSSGWAARSLSATFHQDVRSGERFFDLLVGLQQDPARYLGALEVAYLCLSLGFRGRYRLDARGSAEIDRIRESLHSVISRAHGGIERELSPRWRGVSAPHQGPSRELPSWVIGAIAVAILALGYAVASRIVSTRGDALQERIAQLPPTQLPAIERAVLPVPPAAVSPASGDLVARFRQFLAPEIAQNLVLVEGDAQRLMIRVMSRGMFESGSADLEPRFVGLMQRIGQSLRDEPGRVLVLGHSDNQPIRTVRFPSNFELSAARAESARRVLADAAGQPGRFRSTGRADNEPLASNTTPEGREANRRIEIVLARHGDTP
jgi:type VI secretion system protein ImpK